MENIMTLLFLLATFLSLSDGSISITVSKELTNAGFTYSCILSPGPINDVIVFESPAGTTMGGCGAPLNPTTSGVCNSATSPASTVTQDIAAHTTTIDIPAAYITGNSGLTGAWKCTHGSDQATVSYSNILAFNTDGLSFTSPQTSGDLDSESVSQVKFNMACLFPSATYNIEYLDSESGNAVLYTQTLASTSCTTTIASCTTTDSNAIGQDCSFNVDESKLASKTVFRVTAMVKGMQTTNYPTVVSSFTITIFPETTITTTVNIDENYPMSFTQDEFSTIPTTTNTDKSLTTGNNHSHPNNRGSNESSGLNGGAIAGIVIGCLVVVAVIVVAVVVVVKKKKGSPKKKPDSGNSGSRSVTPNQVSPSIITTDKKIERPSKVDEKNTKPLSPATLALTNEAKPGGRALPPIPQHEKKKKTPRKKKKRVKTEDGEDTEKLPSIQKKERNIEHYTRDTQDPES